MYMIQTCGFDYQKINNTPIEDGDDTCKINEDQEDLLGDEFV